VLIPLLQLALAVVGLAVGSMLVVRGALGIAAIARVRPLVIGLTVTSVGTSLPEIATNLAAALSGRAGVDVSGLAVGNIVGSCLSQITLLLGIAGLVATIRVPPRALRRDSAAVVGALVLMLLFSVDGSPQSAEQRRTS